MAKKIDPLDIIDKKFNHLIVKEHLGMLERRNRRERFYRCLCDCGRYTEATRYRVMNDETKSCGCLKDQYLGTKHGLYYHPIRNMHNSMKQRCSNPNVAGYENYGGRGIRVCDEWSIKHKGVRNFYEWAMANGWKEGLTIEREDVNGNYCPENCKWIPFPEQACNKQDTKRYEYRGDLLTIKQMSELSGIKAATLYNRINILGWDIESSMSVDVCKSRWESAAPSRREMVRGSKLKYTKLREEQIPGIRYLSELGMSRNHLAFMYGCTYSNIESIQKYETWKRVS